MYLFIGAPSLRKVSPYCTEAEYLTFSEAVKEVKFIYYLLCDFHIKVNLPIIIKTDNIGAIFMAENSSTGVRTRHVDTRYHFIRLNTVILNLNLLDPLRMMQIFSPKFWP
jgi:hypothetical protein